jgi:hypothetical protein
MVALVRPRLANWRLLGGHSAALAVIEPFRGGLCANFFVCTVE